MRNQTLPFLEDLRTSINSKASPHLDARMLARILSELVQREVAEGGPYAIIPQGGIEDVDIGLNIVIALFLSTVEVRLPHVDAYIDACIAHGNQTSECVSAQELSELIARYRTLHRVAPATNESPIEYSVEELHMRNAISDALSSRLTSLPNAFVKNAERVIARTIQGNPDKQMSLMALYVREALGTKGTRFSDTYIARLGLVNVFFWTAFIIYDDFWDEDEAAEPGLLPVANLFARHYTDFFSTIFPLDPTFRTFFHTLMDSLDAANEWEMLNCRLRREGDTVFLPETIPDYGEHDIKFSPAAGHVLGPVAMLVECGFPVDSNEVRGLVTYFKHYLIAMQLNDDAHDWKEDLARGHISTAVAMLLSAWQMTHPERKEINLLDDIPELERIFWFETLIPVCTAVKRHTRRSRSALESLTFIQNREPLEQFIRRNEAIADKALTEQRGTAAFLEALSDTPLATGVGSC